MVLECLENVAPANRLADDYVKHQGTDIYTKYLNQITIANIAAKGESAMVCKGLPNLFETSSAEIIANAKKSLRLRFMSCLKLINSYLLRLTN